MQYTITIFPNIKQPNNAHRYTVSFDGLAAFLTKERPAAPKLQQVSWSPYTFDGKRSNKTAQVSTLAVFDFDENTKPVQKIKQQLQNMNLQHVLHTTFSHTEEKHKYRLIIPAGFECAAADQKHFYAAMTQWAKDTLDMTPDKACKDAARTFFTSYRNPKGAMISSIILHGNVVNWEERTKACKKSHAEHIQARREAHSKIVKTTVAELQKLRKTAHDAMFTKPERYITRSDEKRYFYALAACDADLREELAIRLQCSFETAQNDKGEVIRVKATGFQCPYCKRYDTFFYVDPSQSQYAYCAHVKSCSEQYAPKRKGEYRKMQLGYLADMKGLI